MIQIQKQKEKSSVNWEKITEAKEKQLMKLYKECDRALLKGTLEPTLRKMKSDKINEIIPKQERARIVYAYSDILPIGLLCALYGISQSYYRELRIGNQKEWDDIERDKTEEAFRICIEQANSDTITKAEWDDMYESYFDRKLFIIE